MKKFLFSFFGVLLLVAMPQKANAQAALSFDGSNDYAEVLSGSQHIVNKSMSMAFWVFPTNTTGGYPNFDGFAGFRNNSNADFYILQLSGTNVEARFRNSSGVNYDINAAALNVNQWNHYVLTYDQSTLKLYHNGVFVQSVTATGTITNAFAPLHLGKLDWSPTPFYSAIQMDEFGLWARALTQAEVTALASGCSIPNNSAGLKLHYGFNEGIPGGNNVGVSTAIDLTGNTNGTYYNFDMTGTLSNFTSKPGDVMTHDTVQACGLYVDSAGCLHISNLYLTLLQADTALTQVGYTLSMNDTTGSSYQWFDCASGSVVGSGYSFSPTSNGQFACAFTSAQGCMDTSRCVNVTGIGLDEGGLNYWRVSPNPGHSGTLHLQGSDVYQSVTLYDALGQKIAEWHAGEIKQQGLKPGLYYFYIQTQKGEKTLRAILR
jgi:hypothetical protein